MLHVTIEEHSLALGVHTAIGIGQVLHQTLGYILCGNFNIIGLEHSTGQLQEGWGTQCHILDELHDQRIIAETQLQSKYKT